MRSIAEIRALLKEATPESFPALECALASDERKGVQQALATARRRIEREEQEHARLTRLYTFEQELAGGKVVVGLDEVGRGPLAGPVSVARSDGCVHRGTQRFQADRGSEASCYR